MNLFLPFAAYAFLIISDTLFKLVVGNCAESLIMNALLDFENFNDGGSPEDFRNSLW